MVGKGVQIAAGAGIKHAIKKHIGGATLKTIQDMGRRIGFKILQRTIIKYTVPVASAVVGSSYNYVTTKSIGKIAKSHLKNRGKVTDELRLLVSRQNTYDLAFPAAAMYMAQVDGEFSVKEKEFYRALLSRMSFDEHTQAEFQKLISNENNILEAIGEIEDDEVRSSLVEVLGLMAIYDGELVEKEREFLTRTAAQLGVPLDIDEVEQKAKDYRVVLEKSVFRKTAGAAKGAAGSVKNAAATAGGKVTGAFGQIFRRKKEAAEDA